MKQFNFLGVTPGIRIEAHDDGYAITTPYDPAFVAEFKVAIPNSDRKWDKPNRQWIVSRAYGAKVQELIEQHFNAPVTLPVGVVGASQAPTMRILDLRYLGSTKVREDGAETAYGWCDGGWNAIFAKSALMEWFGQEQRPDEAPTLYGVLGLRQDVTPDEIKKAHRRTARQWHPDVCREPGATEQFHAIQDAYEILSDRIKRGKYDAGLKLEGEYRSKASYKRENERPFRSPLRCGLIMCEGVSLLGRFVVAKMHGWQDITDGQGRVLVTFWEAGEDHFTETWTEP